MGVRVGYEGMREDWGRLRGIEEDGGGREGRKRPREAAGDATGD